jgi:hydrogenase maturation protease
VTDGLRTPVLVIGLGNELRGDDGAGIVIARRLRERAFNTGIEAREMGGDPAALLDAWQDREAVVVVDAMRSAAIPGTIWRLDASLAPLPTKLRGCASTHAVGLSEAVELARALEQLPPRIVVYAVEGRTFDAGAGLSAEIQAILPRLAQMVLDEALAASHRPPRRSASPLLRR